MTVYDKTEKNAIENCNCLQAVVYWRKRREATAVSEPCELCSYYVYDEDAEESVCLAAADEDDLYRFYSGAADSCPFFRMDDEYKIVEKQK